MAYGQEEKRWAAGQPTGWKTYTCEFPGCGKSVSRRKSTTVQGKRICRSHEKLAAINIDTTKASTNARYKLISSLQKMAG